MALIEHPYQTNRDRKVTGSFVSTDIRNIAVNTDGRPILYQMHVHISALPKYSAKIPEIKYTMVDGLNMNMMRYSCDLNKEDGEVIDQLSVGQKYWITYGLFECWNSPMHAWLWLFVDKDTFGSNWSERSKRMQDRWLLEMGTAGEKRRQKAKQQKVIDSTLEF